MRSRASSPSMRGSRLSPCARRGDEFAESAIFSGDGTKIVIAIADPPSAEIWDAASGAQIGSLKTHHTDKMSFAVSDSTGTKLATTGWDNTARVQDVASGKEMASIPLEHDDRPTHVPWRAAFSPDGKLLATYSASAAVQIWNTLTGREVQKLIVQGQGGADVAFSPDGRKVAVARDGDVRIFGSATGREIADLRIQGEGDPLITFDRDGSTLMASRDQNVRFWKTREALASRDALLAESCAYRLIGASTLTPDELRLTGYASDAVVDACGP